MQTITELTNQPRQTYNFETEDNYLFDFSLEYIESQQGWFYNLTYGDLEIKGSRLCCSPNILRQYDRLLPFGIAVLSTDLLDPFFLDDFTTGRITLNLITKTEVEEVNDELFG